MTTEPTNPQPAPVTPPAPAPAPPREAETFSREYVSELRGENKGLRLKYTEQEQRAKTAEERAAAAEKVATEAAEAAKVEAEKRASEAELRANERIIRAELRTEAVRAGMVDLDGLKLADLSAVKLNDQGEVEGAADLMAKLKEAKPFLFGQPATGTSNTSTTAPKPASTVKKKATEMTAEEYKASRAQFAAGRIPK